MKTLITPIHLDALLLTQHTIAKEALANFTLLPYSNKERDFNSETPYLAEPILNQPFQDENLLLKAGVHLHWSLPSGLSKSVGIPKLKLTDLDSLSSFFPKSISTQISTWKKVRKLIWKSILIDSGWIKPIHDTLASILNMSVVDQKLFDRGIEKVIITGKLNTPAISVLVQQIMKLLNQPVGNKYPAVPNIWIIARKNKINFEKFWVVESNYISKTQSSDQGNIGSVNVPFHDDRHDNKTAPFRYLGKQKELINSWKLDQSKSANYIHELTAIGYNPQDGTKGFAEPTFAAFYPNSLSVFGFYDPEPKRKSDYEVMGFYSNGEVDYFKNFLKDFSNRYPADEYFFTNLAQVLKSDFHYKMEKTSKINAPKLIPEQTILFGKASPQTIAKPSPNQIEIAIGNTGTEALSAYLASKIKGDKNINEEILESIQFSSKLQNQVLDIGHKFEEARHDKEFTAFEGGILWNLKFETINAQDAQKNSKDGKEKIIFSNKIALLLNQVNKLQSEYDKKIRVTPHLRRQLFSDWYKYMLSSYPTVDNTTFHFDNDELIEYIRTNSIAPLQDNLAQIGTIVFAKDDQGRLTEASSIGDAKSIAVKLESNLKKLIKEVDKFNSKKQSDGKTWKEKGKCLAIRQGAAPRYWKPNDPVILFAEKPKPNQTPALKNNRYKDPSQEELTLCKLFDIPKTNEGITGKKIKEIFNTVSKLFSNKKNTNIGSSNQVWNPFMLEWEVEYLPALPGSHEDNEDRKYDEDYIQKHYQFKETEHDFSLKSDTSVFKNANIYIGSTILTPTSGIILDKVIDQFIEVNKGNQNPSTLKILSDAKNKLKETDVLSQSLGGFNEALVMQNQTRQLDIADPLGFPEYQAFAENEVRPFVEKFNLTAPAPLSDFNPIRSGVMRILSLRMVDTFGQTIDFDSSYFEKNKDKIVVAEPGRLDAIPSGFHLKPRFAQAARINFRLLSGNTDEEEMNDVPISSPICGWLVPNNLDRSILVYDQDGTTLGSLTMNATYPWAPSPGGFSNTNIASIKNNHLRKVVNYLMDKQIDSIKTLGKTDNSFLLKFMDALDSALENVNPENFSEHQDLALLMGRPVAVIRTKLNIELENPPTTDQSWTQLTHELLGQGRTTNAFTKAKIPIRLGEYKQHNDGLLGYWIEEKSGKLEETYYSSEASKNSNPLIKTYESSSKVPMNIFKSLDDEPTFFTMLVDPVGNLQANTGILPIKTISIPKNQYQDALKKMSVTFLTAPILSPTGHLKISLPKESDYEWSFLEKSKKGNWTEIPQMVIIEKSLLDSKFSDEPTLWKRLVAKKWLAPLEDNPERALITGNVHRAFPPNQGAKDKDPFSIDLGKRVDNFFDTYGKRIETFDLLSNFSGPQTIREGWLKLNEVK